MMGDILRLCAVVSTESIVNQASVWYSLWYGYRNLCIVWCRKESFTVVLIEE